jgi:antimicrobial peptide system SdpA family protein
MHVHRWSRPHPVALAHALGCAVASMLALGLLLAAVPDTPLAPGYRARASILSIAPEGWGFFTRDPQEEEVHVWHVQADGSVEPSNPADRRGLAFAGVSRRTRVLGIEIGQVLQRVPHTAWTPCRGRVDACGDRTVLRIANTMRVRSLCGRYIIERKRPIPWAWAATSRPTAMPARIVEVDIECEGVGGGT